MQSGKLKDKSETDQSSKKIEDLSTRALPPLPPKKPQQDDNIEDQALDFATSIQEVKDVSLIRNQSILVVKESGFSMDGIGALYPVKPPKKSCQTNQTGHL